MEFNKTILYKNHKKSTGSWSIWAEHNVIYMESKTSAHHIGSKYKEFVEIGKAGRTLAQQIQSRLNSRINAKLDNGYVHTIEEAKKPITNTMGLLAPMLAEKIQNIKNLNKNECYIQTKLDGHRCLITRQDDDIVAYSRRGKNITTIDHILKYIDIPYGVTLDGELYCHGASLQTISSWANRLQPNSLKLQFIGYDLIVHDDPDMIFKDRIAALRQLHKSSISTTDFHMILYTMPYLNLKVSLNEKLKEIRAEGYEGLILRPRDGKYGIGRRSKDLIKVKVYEDDEFPVIKITEALRNPHAVLHLKASNGLSFKALAPGTHYEKAYVLKNKEEYIGRLVTIEYANLTDKGIPFQPVARNWKVEL